MSTIKKLLTARTNSWEDLYTKLIKLDDDANHSKAGFLLEHFAKLYFMETGEYKKVQLYEELSASDKKKYELPKRDKGVDLLLHSNQGRVIAVQVKFRKYKSSTLSWGSDKLSHLIGHHKKIDQHFVFSNATGVGKDVKKQAKNIQTILINDLLELKKEHFNRYRDIIKAGKPKKRKPFTPKTHQASAIKDIIKGFKTENRGQLIFPCGAGKTLTSLWLKEKMKAKKTLVLVPSLALLRQIKNEWREQKRSDSNYFCVCSEKDIDKDKSTKHDIFSGSIYELGASGLGVTTDSKTIRNYLKTPGDVVVFSTYQSTPELVKALKGRKFAFDLAICDEAHKTATKKESSFATIHDDKKIKVKKRLYMTATPRIISETVTNSRGEDVTKYIADMNNPHIYGDEFHRMSFAQAIKEKILVDYKIVAIGVSNKELEKKIKRRDYVEGEGFKTLEERANHIALKKAMTKYKATHAITFHSSIQKAEDFWKRHKIENKSCEAFHVSGKHSTADRKSALNDFKNEKKALVTNARCLTEGVDVPAIDLVYFCDPKNSKIDIVQAAGRSLRRSPGKKFGLIVVPIYHSDKDNIEEEIQSGVYKNLVQTIRAMSDQDERLEEEIRRIIWGDGKRKSARIQVDLEKAEKGTVKLEGIANQLKKDIFSHAIRKSLKSQWMPFEQAREFVRKLELKNLKEWNLYSKGELKGYPKKPDYIPAGPPQTYKENWTSWSDFLGNTNIATHLRKYKTFLEAKKIARDLSLKSQKEWFMYTKGKLPGVQKKPDSIPGYPNRVYKDDWDGWGDWLGTGNIAPCDKKYRSFKEARKFARKLGLKNLRQWASYCRGELKHLPKKPIDIPRNIRTTYKDEWKDIADWLGTSKTLKNSKLEPRSFKAATIFVKKLNLKSNREWRSYCKGEIKNLPPKPIDIPSNPQRTYKQYWKGWGYWLGNKNKSNWKKTFLPFNVARDFVRSLGLKSCLEWQLYCKDELVGKSRKPDNIPSSPNTKYKEYWKGWGDFLGTNIASVKNKKTA